MGIRNYLSKKLKTPVARLSARYSSRPDKARIFHALSDLLKCIREHKTKKGVIIPFEADKARFIIFSDHHKGGKNGADDFMSNETNYVAALEHYYRNGYHLVVLGDCEELWENSIFTVMKKNKLAFDAEKKFIPNNAFIKIFGNHDLDWGNDPFAALYLKQIYDSTVKIYEGVILETVLDNKKLSIFCTHGHQGDKQSDGNWFSKFFVAKIWAPFQSYLRINPNTPAYDAGLKSLHNNLMYEWSREQKDLLLITGHTHQPVFESLTHLERLYRLLLIARKDKNEEQIKAIEEEIKIRQYSSTEVSEDFMTMKPTYFNTGCCCFSDGDITGIEIIDGFMMLIKWKLVDGIPTRMVLEETNLEDILNMKI